MPTFWCDQSFHVYCVLGCAQSNDLYAMCHTEFLCLKSKAVNDNDKHLLGNIVNNDDCFDGLSNQKLISRHVVT